MMGSYSDSDEECFFDSREEITSVSDLGSDCNESCSPNWGDECVLGYDFWKKDPKSVDERRDRFLKWIGESPSWYRPADRQEQSDIITTGDRKMVADRIRDGGETVLANSDSQDSCFSGRSSQSFQSNEALEMDEDAREVGLHLKIRNLDNGVEFVVDEFSQEGMVSQVREVGSNKLFTAEEFQRTLGPSPLVQKYLRRVPVEIDTVDEAKTKTKRSWLQKLSVATHNKVKSMGDKVKSKESNLKPGTNIQRVRVHTCGKESKELSSLYTGQEFPAHKGSISTMKFSPCGQYLASAGKDGSVRIWRVIADEIPNNLNSHDSESLYFSLTHTSKIASLNDNKEKIRGSKMMRKSSESACVVLPPKIFRILEKPLHEFHGHRGEVLALSWSRNGYLLSSSVDKTARLWQVGLDQCRGIYSHNNYVTCVDFNPMDDNFFISGSIDGKIRLWEVHGCRVIDWTDVKEIVTAVCYLPDGKGGVVGSMDGNCRFYDVVGTDAYFLNLLFAPLIFQKSKTQK